MKEILLIFIVFAITLGCIAPEVEEEKIVKNASGLVLTLEDVGDKWLPGPYITTQNTSASSFGSKQRAHFFDQKARYGLYNNVTLFPNITSAKIDFAEYYRRISEVHGRLKSADVGDESFFIIGRSVGRVFFRYRNVIVYMDILDFDEKFDIPKEELIGYAKIVEQKIKRAEAES